MSKKSRLIKKRRTRRIKEVNKKIRDARSNVNVNKEALRRLDMTLKKLNQKGGVFNKKSSISNIAIDAALKKVEKSPYFNPEEKKIMYERGKKTFLFNHPGVTDEQYESLMSIFQTKVWEHLREEYERDSEIMVDSLLDLNQFKDDIRVDVLDVLRDFQKSEIKERGLRFYVDTLLETDRVGN